MNQIDADEVRCSTFGAFREAERYELQPIQTSILPMTQDIAARLQKARAEVARLEELHDLLKRNPDMERVFSLMQSVRL